MAITNISLLTLPVELIHLIFDFCDTRSIVLSFRYACKQCYTLVESYDRFSLNFDSNSMTDYATICRTIQPSNIVSINISNRYADRNESPTLLPLFARGQWTRLRSLTYHNDNIDNLEYILQCIKSNCLVSLSIHSTTYQCGKIAALISSVLERFNLGKLYLNSTVDIFRYLQWPTSCTLNHLEIHTCYYSDYVLILNQLCYLKTFVMKNCVMNVSDGDAYSPSNAKLDVGLISLTICECTLPRDSIELLLCETPLLRHFKLVCHRTTFDSIFDGLDWELFIRNNLPALEKFEFFFSYRCKRPDPFHGLSSGIASFQSRFWLEEKHWFVVAANPIKLPEFWLYTRPLSNIDYATSQARYELASINDGYRLIARPIDAISHTDLNVTLATLDLADNRIKNLGAKYLADALKDNKTLMTLDVKRNGIEVEGVEYLANALKYNTTLTTLDLRSNGIDKRGAKYIADALLKNMTLQTLYLAFNQIGDLGSQYMANALQHNNALIKLDLGQNTIDEAGAQFLAVALKMNTVIHVVLFIDIIFIVPILFNQTLTSLSLRSNLFGQNGRQYLVNALEQNTTLTIYDLGDDLTETETSNLS
ncbi:unnamed protein product [Rotaria socialis]|uniref:F-box domain-containing protein n=1 Tax=Rotaria socialis TaxID=392032 RepID=A0A818J0R7_9BILA|nr:unnamed protein product [Rotaria socialis]